MDELNRKIPRVFIQSFCNNSLYGDVCGLNKAAYYRTANNITVDPNNNSLISATIISTYPNDYFTAGYAEFNNEQRYISKHTGNTIVLHFPFLGLVNGDTILIYPGCSKNPETCKTKFNNLNNFVGMPYISKSPNPTIYGVD
jgi:uncharacterized phage protein (TIGR02218 family)